MSPRQRWPRQQVAAFIRPGVSLETHHIAQEASGVRMRTPLGDIDLWEFFLQMPAEVKLPGHQPKQVIRRLMRGRLPDSVLDRSDKTLLDAFVVAGMDYPGLRPMEEGAGGVRLHLDTGEYRQLNQVGATIWSLLEDEPSRDELVAALHDRFGNAPRQMEQEVDAFLAALEERQLVQASERTDA